MQGRAQTGGFIVSPRYDTCFFTGSLVLPMLLWAAFSLGWMTGVAVYVVFQLAFNLPHNFQTWTLSLLDTKDRDRHGRAYLVAAGVILALFGGAMLFSPEGLYPWVRDALIYWGYYHLVRQHYGFQRMYERKAGGVSPRESQLYARYLDAVSYLPLLLRFRDPSLMTLHAGKVSLRITSPTLSPLLWKPLAVLYIAIVVGACVHHGVLWWRGRRGLGPRALHFAAVTWVFGFAGLGVRDLLVAIAVVTAFHNLQYLGLLWFHNSERARLGETAGNPSVRWIQEGRWGWYLLATFAYGVVILAPRVLLPSVRAAELPFIGVVALHYFVDSRLWRFKDHPERGRYLGLTRPAAGAVAPGAPAP